ncbi:MAG: hypothetical protein GVY22_01075 [Gammaproteobacteria bacterium]|jgi:uroporphyrinogen decarboxylase|nr:hypothetical protein [Gammaproteobacteria bacterium]
MTRYRDLLSAALQGESLAITPVAVWRHYPERDQDSDSLAEATLADQARFDGDLVKLTPASTWQSRDQGLVDEWAGDAIGRRAIVSRPVQVPTDWLRLKQLDPWRGFSARILHSVERVRRALPGDIPLLATVFNPIFQAVQLAGFDTLRNHAHAHQPELTQGLDTLLRNTLSVIGALADLGVDGIFLATQHAGRSALAPEPYGSLALPADRACLEAAPLPFNILHLHGPDLHWEPFVDLTSAIIHYDATPENPEPAMLASRVARGLATGPHPAGTLLHGDPQTLRADIMALRQRLFGRRFFLAPGCALPLAVREAQIMAMMRAAREPLSASAP